jgi:hypothetical protein
MVLRLTIALLRWTLGVMVVLTVTLLLGRGRMARRVLKALRITRRLVRL